MGIPTKVHDILPLGVYHIVNPIYKIGHQHQPMLKGRICLPIEEGLSGVCFQPYCYANEGGLFNPTSRVYD